MDRSDGRLSAIEGILGRPLLGEDRIDAEEALAAGRDPAELASEMNRWELGGALSLLDLGESVAMSGVVQGHTRRARGWLFGRSAPPFTSAQEARAWIEDQVGDEQKAIYRENELEENGLLDECRQRALDAVGPSADAYEWSITATAWRVHLPALHPTEQAYDLEKKIESELGRPLTSEHRKEIKATLKAGADRAARSGLYRPYTALDSLDDRGEEWSPEEDAWPACTELLRRLAARARDLARTTGCWSLGQATAYILTGEPPQLPKLQLWTNRIPADRDIPGGGLRYTIQLQGAVTREEWLRLFRVLRGHTGPERTRPKEKDETVVRFLGPKLNGRNLRPEYKSRDVLEEWNREYPERPFKTYQGLRNAYSRPRKRLGRSGSA